MPARKPKLNLEKGHTYTLKLLFDEPKSGTSDKGRPWNLYTAEYQGQEVIFFTPNETVHQDIQKTGKKQGDMLTIGVDNRGNWHVGDAAAAELEADQVFGDAGTASNSLNMPSASAPARRTFESLVEDYRACLGVALELCVSEFDEYSNEDVRSIATTLYIQGVREKVNFPKE